MLCCGVTLEMAPPVRTGPGGARVPSQRHDLPLLKKAKMAITRGGRCTVFALCEFLPQNIIRPNIAADGAVRRAHVHP
jgi:hypothetical protein